MEPQTDRPLQTCHSNIAIILAAGQSIRMGTCKTSLLWHGNQTLLEYQIAQCMLAGFTPIVVLGPHNARQHCPETTQVVINPAPERGKTSSILAGLAAIPTPFSGLMIVAVDQPRPAAIYRALLHAHQRQEALITAPIWGDRLGHPLVFAHAMLPHLQRINEETMGLRAIVQAFDPLIQRIECHSAIVLSNLNTRECYERERKEEKRKKKEERKKKREEQALVVTVGAKHSLMQ